MSEHRASLAWQKGDQPFELKTYSRNHTVRFPNGAELGASSAPDFAGDPTKVDPESMLVSALASCHMLTFLAFCAREQLVVEQYEDAAVGHLERNAARQFAVTRVDLHPRVRFATGVDVPRAKLEELHHKAHAACFIANSVSCAVDVKLDG